MTVWYTHRAYGCPELLSHCPAVDKIMSTKCCNGQWRSESVTMAEADRSLGENRSGKMNQKWKLIWFDYWAILQPTGHELVQKLGKRSLGVLHWLGMIKCLCASLPTSSGERMWNLICFTGLELVKEGSQSAFFILQFPKEAYKYLGIRSFVNRVYTHNLSGIRLASVQFQREFSSNYSQLKQKPPTTDYCGVLFSEHLGTD